MFKFSFPNKLDKKVPLLLPVCSDQIKTVPKKLLNGLSKKQTEAVRAALRKGVPDDGLLPVYSGDATVLLMLLAKEKSLKTRSVRETSSQIFSAARKYKIDGLTILTGTLNDELVRAMREGIVIGSYEYNDWKGVIHKEKAKKQTTLKSVSFTGNKTAGESKRLLQLQKSIALTKDLINCPPKTATPSYLEKKSREIARQLKDVKVTVFKEKELKKMGCNGILAVGRGSHEESRLIILEYKGGGKKAPIALVGKGVTFDTGGYSLKPSQYLESMKQDLGGAATALGGFYAIASLGVKKNVIAVIPTVENSINSHAYRPDDVIKMYNGVTVEVTNTDAEGRIILGDALAYTAKKYNPRAMIDMATLTGACAYAVGNDFTAALGTNNDLISKIIESGKEVDEPVWELPLHERYKKELDSPIADIVNCSKLKAGTVEGGLFLQHFVPKEINWCHLDIASVAFDESKKQATGRNVRMLLNFVKKY